MLSPPLGRRTEPEALKYMGCRVSELHQTGESDGKENGTSNGIGSILGFIGCCEGILGGSLDIVSRLTMPNNPATLP